MIDQGFCFNAGEWNFPDAPLRGLYARHRVYESVRGMESFAPWINRLENRIGKDVLDECAAQIYPGVVRLRYGRAVHAAGVSGPAARTRDGIDRGRVEIFAPTFCTLDVSYG